MKSAGLDCLAFDGCGKLIARDFFIPRLVLDSLCSALAEVGPRLGGSPLLGLVV